MAYRSSSNVTGTGVATVNVPVPSGAAANDIAILVVNIDGTGHGTITWPSGFTLLFKTEVASPDGHTQGIAWKRLTGADSGNYTVSWTGSNDVIGQCNLFSGRHTSNPPVASQASNTSSNSSPISVGAATVTAVTGDDLLWAGGLDMNSNITTTSCAAPSTYTERQDSNHLWCALSTATKDNVSAGATGTVTGTFTTTTTAGWLAHLVRIPAAASGPGSVVADAGSYAVTGTAAALELGREVAGASGSYAVTGTAASLELGREVAGESGSYGVTGTAAALELGREVAGNSGSYAVSGTDAGLSITDKIVVAAGGSYAVTGTAADLEIGKEVTADSGSYSVAGTAANLELGREVLGGSGDYVVSGSDATLTVTGAGEERTLAADPGSYDVVGSSTSLELGREVAAENGSYAVSGQAIGLSRGLPIVIGSGSYTIAGTAAALELGRELAMDGGTYVVSGSSVGLAYSGDIGEGGYLPANLPMIETMGMMKAFGGV
jgi:hypothetical protein